MKTETILYNLIMQYPKEKEYLQLPGDFNKIPNEMCKLLDGIDIEDLCLVRYASHGMSPNFVVTKVEEVSEIHTPPHGENPGGVEATANVYITDTPTKAQCMMAWNSNLKYAREIKVPYPSETIFALVKSKLFTITNEGKKITPSLYASEKDLSTYLFQIRDDLTEAAAADDPTERERELLLANETVRRFNPYIHALKKEPDFMNRPITELAEVILDYFEEVTGSADTLIQSDRKLDILKWDILADHFRFFFPCTKRDLKAFIDFARKRLGTPTGPTQRTVLPEHYLVETDKGAQKVFDGTLFKAHGQEWIIDVGKPKKKIQRFISIDFDQIPPEIFKRQLSSYDWLIHDAINSIYQAGNQFMTISTIANVITGNPDSDYNPSPKTRREIEDSIQALISTPIRMNYSEEAQAYKVGFDYQEGKTYQYYGNVINGEIVTQRVNGQLTDGVLHILKEPILFSLARKKNQISTIDIKFLSSPTYMTKTALELRDYLMRRIERMRPTGKKQTPKKLTHRTIKLVSMYEAVGAENKRSDEKKRIFDKAVLFLDDLKAKKYFSDYAIDNERIYIAESLPQKKEIDQIKRQSFL